MRPRTPARSILSGWLNLVTAWACRLTSSIGGTSTGVRSGTTRYARQPSKRSFSNSMHGLT